MRRVRIALLVGLAGCGGGLEVPSAVPAGKVALYWAAATTEVELGAPVGLRLWMRAAPGVDAKPPAVETRYRDVAGLRIGATGPGRWIDHAGDRFWTRPYRLQWFRLGKQTLPPLEVAAKAGAADGGGAVEAATEDLEFRVTRVLPEGAGGRAELPADVIVDPPPPPVWPWVAGAAALAATFWVVRRLLRRRAGRDPEPAPRPMVPADQLALARIKELERMLVEGQVGGERLVLEVSNVLRRWLHVGLSQHALDRTTEEFLAELGRGTRLPLALRNILTAFLEQCDLVKFAAQRPDLDQCRALLQTARDFIRTTCEHGQEPAAAVGAGAVAAAGGTGG